jgi:hypothetical protein
MPKASEVNTIRKSRQLPRRSDATFAIKKENRAECDQPEHAKWLPRFEDRNKREHDRYRRYSQGMKFFQPFTKLFVSVAGC